jgi:gas vesicle protein
MNPIHTLGATLSSGTTDAVQLEGAVIGAVAIIIAALLGLIATLLGLQRRSTMQARIASDRAAIKADQAAINAKEVHTTVTAIKDQVANGHIDENGAPINLRDDIDEVVLSIREMRKEMRLDIGGLRAELRQVREDRSADRADTNKALDRMRKAIERK